MAKICSLQALAVELDAFSLRLDGPGIAGHESEWLDYARRHLSDLAYSVREMRKDEAMKIDLSQDEQGYLIKLLEGIDGRRAKAIRRKLRLSESPLRSVIEELHARANGNWDPNPTNLHYLLTCWANQLEMIAEKELTRA